MGGLLLLVLVVLTPAVMSAETLTGAVEDAMNTPIAGALLIIRWDPAGAGILGDNIGIKAEICVRTGDGGAFTVDMPPGFYDVFAAARAFTPGCRRSDKSGPPAKITFRLNADPLYSAERGDRFEVRPKR